MVNNMSQEIEAVRDLFLALGFAKKITHVAGRKGATAMDKPVAMRTIINALDREHHDNWKRFEGVKCTYRPACMRPRGYPPVGWNKILKEKFTAAHKSNNGNCWPTTGLFAIDLALMENHPCEIHLFGFDFYNDKYLIKQNRPYQTQDNPKVKCMYKYLQKLVDEFKDTRFYCYTKLNIIGDNWVEI